MDLSVNFSTLVIAVLRQKKRATLLSITHFSLVAQFSVYNMRAINRNIILFDQNLFKAIDE